MRIDVPHKGSGQIPLVGSPTKFARAPLDDRQHPPQLGEHNDEVLTGILGLDDDELALLRMA